MIKSKKLSTKLFGLCSDESIISHWMILNRYLLFCVYNFIETFFYINKTIYSLSITTTSVDKLYSSNALDLYNNKNVSYTRLKNIIDILDSCIMIVEGHKETIADTDMKDNYYKLFEECCKEYKNFKESLNSEFRYFIEEKNNSEILLYE